ncbi:MAG: thioredoxin family protein [Phycisphaerales bacterium]|nr:thioredoxin family protein [Phycisphaerales bacterium]
MPATASTMMELGTTAPDFTLPNVDGVPVSLDQFRGCDALLVMFICNHCPFVVHIREELIRLANDVLPRNVGVVAINSNDSDAYPDDSPAKMGIDSRQFNYPFYYLFDETQDIAKAYGAACTPDFFLFDGDQKLVYRGQLDESRPKNDTPVTGSDLRAAIAAVLAGTPVASEQKPSLGCNIKWKPGNEPEYFTAS